MRLDGAVESSVRLGVADVVADVVETGSTLRAAGLEVFGDPILMSEAILITAPGAPADEIATLTGGTNSTIEGADAVFQQITMAPEPKPLERRTRLWSSPWWGGAILALLTIYWLGRKMQGML